MISVAHELRRQRVAADGWLSFRERLEQAFALGEADARLLAAHRGIALAEATHVLRRQRQHGRRPSCTRDLT